MKLLFDQNLSYRLVDILNSYYPGSQHIKNLGLQKENDKNIWSYAKENDFTIVTQDADFYELSLLYESPPKIIWLRCGNTSTNNIFNILKDNQKIISDFIVDENHSCLELF